LEISDLMQCLSSRAHSETMSLVHFVELLTRVCLQSNTFFYWVLSTYGF